MLEILPTWDQMGQGPGTTHQRYPAPPPDRTAGVTREQLTGKEVFKSMNTITPAFT